jgi:hypothetical protein
MRTLSGIGKSLPNIYEKIKEMPGKGAADIWIGCLFI